MTPGTRAWSAIIFALFVITACTGSHDIEGRDYLASIKTSEAFSAGELQDAYKNYEIIKELYRVTADHFVLDTQMDRATSDIQIIEGKILGLHPSIDKNAAREAAMGEGSDGAVKLKSLNRDYADHPFSRDVYREVIEMLDENTVRVERLGR